MKNRRHSIEKKIIDRALLETISGYIAFFIAGAALMTVVVML